MLASLVIMSEHMFHMFGVYKCRQWCCDGTAVNCNCLSPSRGVRVWLLHVCACYFWQCAKQQTPAPRRNNYRII